MARKSRNNSNNRSGNARSRQTAQSASNQPTSRRERRTDVVQSRKADRQKLAQKQKRQWLYTKIGIGVVVLALVGWLGYAGFQAWQGYELRQDVTEYFGKDAFAALHYETGEVLYEQVPPTGGYHNSVWQNCGFYDKYIVNWHGVHSLEHGAVWITYDPGITEDQKNTLRDIADQPYILVSPYPNMGAMITLSIWGHQLKMDSFDRDKIDTFIREYRAKQEYTPEFNGICYSGTSGTTDVVPQQVPLTLESPDGEPIGGLPAEYVTATVAAQQGQESTPESTPEATEPVAEGTPETGTGGVSTPEQDSGTGESTPAAGTPEVATPVGTPEASPSSSG